MHTLEWKRNSLMFGRCTKQFHLGKVHLLTRFSLLFGTPRVPIQEKSRAVVFCVPVWRVQLEFVLSTAEADTHLRNLHVHGCSGVHELGSARSSTLNSPS